MKVLHVFYDLSVNPLTFDIMNFMCMADLFTRKYDLDGYFLHIVKGEWRMGTPKDLALTDDERNLRVKTIIEPMARLGKRCVGYSVYNDRSLVPNTDNMSKFPGDYSVHRPTTNVLLINAFSIAETLGLTKEQIEEQFNDVFDSSPEYDAMVRRHYPEAPVVLSGRESRIEKTKNSAVKWEYIDEADVIIPDLETIFTYSRTSFVDSETLAAVNIEYRMALYKYAKLVVADAGGPNFVPFFMQGTNVRVFQSLDRLDAVAQGDRKRKALLMGLNDIGEQWPHVEAGKNRIIWYKGDLTEQMVIDTILREAQ